MKENHLVRVEKDMKELAVVICNYNGGKDTVNCIRKVLNNSFSDMDVYVVDNASDDDSVGLIREAFGEKITLLHNADNLGGSGGFGRGLRYAVELDYQYILTLDNDAFIESDTIEILYKYIEDNVDVGIVGAKIMTIDDNNIVMDFAKKIDWDSFTESSEWSYSTDIPEKTEHAVECDFVAATCALIRKEALIKAGGMDEAHFIYFDDIDMSHRIRMAGYKSICLGTAKAYHKSTMNTVKANTFANYYYTRNKYHFFAKYLPEERLEEFADYVINQVFPYIYGSHKSGREDMFLTYKYILEDFMNDIRGKARPGRINPIHNVWPENIAKLVGDKKRIAICMLDGGRETTYHKVIDAIDQLDGDVHYEKVESIVASGYDLVIALCDHVKDQSDNILPAVYIDAYGNIIDDYKSYLYFQNYDNAFELFKHMYKPSVMEGIHKIRESHS